MDNVIKSITVDLYSPTSYEVIKAQQGDNNSRIIEFILYNQGEPYTIAKNISIRMEGHRGDGSSFIKENCTVSNNIISAIIDSDILYEHGIVEAKLVMYDISNNAILSTIPFKIHVQKNPCDKNKVEQDKTSLIDDILLIVDKAKKAFEEHINNFLNPHNVTKAQVGLGLADNTPDIEKNVNSAKKLTTARKINNTLFDGTAEITTDKWGKSRTVTLSGDVSGSKEVDGSSNFDISVTVKDNSHEHTVSNISDLTATASELNVLDGITSTTTELNKLHGTTATVDDFNKLHDVTASASELNIMDGVTATTTELNYVDGVTSNIQTQLNSKQSNITGGATTITSSNLTASRALISNSSGKVAVSDVTSTELGYLDGVTSNIQTQLDTKAPLASPTLTGAPKAPTATAGTNSTQIATTAFVQTAVSNLVNSAPETLDTLGEIADALKDNADIVDVLNESIATKANASDLASHTSNTTVHITATERSNWNDANSKKHTHQNKTILDNTTASYTTTEQTKLSGIATGAEVNQNAFSNVVVGTTTISADSKTDSLTLTGSNVTLTPDTTNDKVTIGITKANVTSALGYTPPTTNTTYGVATSSTLGLVKSGTDITVDGSGNVSVNDDSHNHVISNVDGLQTALDGKASSSHTHSSYVNQNAFSNVTVGSTTIAADTTTDTLTLVAGSNVTITPDATNDKITISSTDTKYTHPTTSGNKHIPSGGSSGQILRWSADGTAVWGADNNTTYGVVSTTADGLAPKRDGSTTKYLRADGTWAVPPDTNTTYSKLSQFTNDSGYITGITKSMVTTALGYTPPTTNTTYSQATSSALGLVKIGYSASGKNYAVQLDSNGKMYVNVPWTDTDTNTTYSNATTSAAGLMSASDKSKLDAITASADSVSYSQNWSGGEKIGTITINGTGIDIYSPGITSSLSSTSGITALSASAGKSLQDQINNITSVLDPSADIPVKMRTYTLTSGNYMVLSSFANGWMVRGLILTIIGSVANLYGFTRGGSTYYVYNIAINQNSNMMYAYVDNINLALKNANTNNTGTAIILYQEN